jgi:natural product precursor
MKKIQIQSKKLQLNKTKVTDLSKNEMTHVLGGADVNVPGDAPIGDAPAAGFLSIGHACSMRNTCNRVSRGCVCCPDNVAVATNNPIAG